MSEHYENQLSIYNGVRELKFGGSVKWILPFREIDEYICDGQDYANAELKIVATLTDYLNGERVEGYGTTSVTRKDLNMGFSIPSPSMFQYDMPFHASVSNKSIMEFTKRFYERTHFLQIWVQKGNGHPLSRSQLQFGELLVELNLQWSDGQKDQISAPFPVRRRSKFYGNRHEWQVTVPSLKRHAEKRSGKAEIASVTATATFSTSNGLKSSANLVLLPENNSTYAMPRLQLTTSTHDPKVGENMIFHVRSNHFLEDFYLVIIADGRLLTAKPISMGLSKLRTFHERITSDMTPSVSFVLWHIDKSGTLVHTSLTVQTTSKTNTSVSCFLYL